MPGLGGEAGVEPGETLASEDVGRDAPVRRRFLPKKLREAERHRLSRRGLLQEFALHIRAHDVRGAVKEGGEGSGSEAREHLVPRGERRRRGPAVAVHANQREGVVDAPLEEAEGPEEGARPGRLAPLDPQVARVDPKDAALGDAVVEHRGASVAEAVGGVELEAHLGGLDGPDGEALHDGARGARRGPGERRPLALGRVEHGLVEDREEEELERLHRRRPGNLRRGALANEAAPSVSSLEGHNRVDDAPSVGVASLRHADGSEDVHRVHGDGRDQAGGKRRRKNVAMQEGRHRQGRCHG
mmetsp:Transcript_27827/g.93040  ORF Transcript_27827/g.93040 Transcript_27827/m.93040 type:complete len:300 (-) Transcript_27827:245-1144(-)